MLLYQTLAFTIDQKKKKKRKSLKKIVNLKHQL